MANFSATVDLGGDETIVKNVQDNAFSPATVAAKSKVLMCAKHPGIWVCQPAYFGFSQKIRDCPHCIAEFSANIGDISPVSVVSNSNVSTSASSLTNAGNSPTNNSSKNVVIDASHPTCEFIYDLAKNNKWDEVLTIFKSDERFARKTVKYVKPSSGWSLLHQAAYWGERTVWNTVQILS
jgi:hypothetical protein